MVIMGNLGSHTSIAVSQMIRDAGAKSHSLPPYPSTLLLLASNVVPIILLDVVVEGVMTGREW